MRILTAVLLLAPVMPAGQKENQIFVFGDPPVCSRFVAAMEGRKLNAPLVLEPNGGVFWGENSMMMEYVYGFLTAVNDHRDRDHQIQLDNSSIELWLRDWCTKNPKHTLTDAVHEFTAETPGTPLR